MSVVEALQRGLHTALERLRGSGMGTHDPNIVGDAGPVDVPPGRDPETAGGIFATDEAPGVDLGEDRANGVAIDEPPAEPGATMGD
jgi:hypothetical protein